MGTPAAGRHERRAYERTEILGDLRGEIMVYEPMVVRDISHGGALIESTFPLHIDSLHDIRLELGTDAVIVKGRVVHCSVGDMDREFVVYRSGVEFIEPSAGVREIIARFIERTRTARLGDTSGRAAT